VKIKKRSIGRTTSKSVYPWNVAYLYCRGCEKKYKKPKRLVWVEFQT